MKRWVLIWTSATQKERYFKGWDDSGGIVSTRDPMEAAFWPTPRGAYDFAAPIRVLQYWTVGERAYRDTFQALYRSAA